MTATRWRRSARRHLRLVAAAGAAGLGLAAVWWYGSTPAHRSSVVIRFLESEPDEIASEVLLLRSADVIGTVVDDLGLRLRWDGEVPPELATDVQVRAEPAARWSGDLHFDSAGALHRRGGGRAPVSASYGSRLELPGVALTVTKAPTADRARLDLVTRDDAIADLAHALEVRIPSGRTDVVVTVGSLDPVAGAAQVEALGRAFEAARRDRARTRALERRAALVAAAAERPNVTLDAELALSHLEEASAAGAVDLILPAPASVARPRVGPVVLVLGAVAGCLMALMILVVLEVRRGALTRLEDAERELAVAALGIIPRIAATGGHRRQAVTGSAARRMEEFASPARRAGAEAFRTLRTHLTLATGDVPHTLLFTGTGFEAGTTTTVLHMGLAFADQGLKTLVVDSDFRRPSLARLFGLPDGPGLTDVLTGAVHPTRAIRQTPFDRLDVLPNGTEVDRHLELLGGEEMPRFLADLERRYHIVLFDSPPVSSTADAVVLAAMVAGVVVVLRAGRDDGEAGRRVLRQLRHVGATVLGVVLNDPERQPVSRSPRRADAPGEGVA